ncbi:GNAT family N-acetyltransferase [Lacticaseibacillus baoqingensis]|uniref:GNAT family N-acetyltransferase n=1 Tax=Lacticaseibacillus baoqingensis TaxID=2486013 RepID=A0ABW4E536_9LACO|nr:N-acetyltransferase [Lacticaseibacillus baoqingensis]
MALFEKYHPLLSAHYTLDWLTAAKLKAVFALRQDPTQAALSRRKRDDTITATAQYVNHAMHLVMSNQALIYGIIARHSQQFVGSVELRQFDSAFTQAQLRLEVAPQQDPIPLYAEIIPRIVGFAFFELGLETITMPVPTTATVLLSWLRTNHFQAAPELNPRTQSAEQQGPLLQMTLAKAAVSDDPHYRF